jgi:hypothetical protein
MTYLTKRANHVVLCYLTYKSVVFGFCVLIHLVNCVEFGLT